MTYLNREDNVSKIPFSHRAFNVLKRTGIITVGDLLDRYKEIGQVYGSGKKTSEEVYSFIDDISRQENYKLVDVTEIKKIVEKIGNDNISNTSNESLDKLNLSRRTRNALRWAGYNYIYEISGLSLDDFLTIRNMGWKSANEVFEKMAPYRVDDSIVADIAGDLDIANTYEGMSRLEISPGEIMDILVSVRKEMPDIHAESYTLCVYNNDDVKNHLRDFILNQLEVHDNEMTLSEIEIELPPATRNTSICLSTIIDLENSGKVIIRDQTVKRVYPTVVQALTNSGIKDADLVIKKINGETLEEIGGEIGCTRERARQRIKKSISKFHEKVAEEKYIYLWNNYSIDKNTFLKMFPEEKASTVLYLQLVENRGHGLRTLDEIYDDDIVPQYYKERYQDNIDNVGFVVIDGKKIRKKRQNIIDYIMQNYCRDCTVPFDEFITMVNDFIEENCADEVNKIRPSSSLNNLLSRDINYFYKGRNGVRYHYFNMDEFNSFIDEIDISQYDGMCISARLIYDTYRDVMEKYDLQDEFEVHEYIKKGNDMLPAPILISGRNPTLKFGDCERDDQVKSLLYQLAPITKDEFAEQYSEKYGDNKATVLGSFLTCIDEYCVNGIYDIKQKELPKEQQETLQKVIVNDFYPMYEVKEIFRNQGVDQQYVNVLNLKRLGYKVYSNCIVSAKYDNINRYINNKVFADDIVDLDDYSSVLISSQAFYICLREQDRYYEFSPRKYISLERLEKAGVTEETMKKFCHRALMSVQDNAYFTICSLYKNGFEDELDDYGFDDVFYDSLLLKYSTKLSHKKMSNGMLFFKGDRKITLQDFLEWILDGIKKIEIDELIDLLQSKYGMRFKKYKLIEEIDGSEQLYYDRIYETVYIDYDYYFEEI